MVKKIVRTLAIALLSVSLIGVGSPVPAEENTNKNRAPVGQWAENPEMKVRVIKVEEATAWDQISFNKRLTPAQDKKFDRALKKQLKDGIVKLIFVTAEAKNISDRKVKIGYAPIQASGGLFWIRGDEGSEQSSYQKNKFYYDIKHFDPYATELNRYLVGSFPKSAELSPGGMASGKLVFVVPAWFTPTVFFTKARLGDKNFEIIIKLN